jgi:hypothetical protein
MTASCLPHSTGAGPSEWLKTPQSLLRCNHSRDKLGVYQLTESCSRLWRELILNYVSNDPVSLMAQA